MPVPRDGAPPARAEAVTPGYRDSLANERTFLAWIRTALSLIAAAVAVVKFVPPFAVPGTRLLLGLILAGGGLMLAVVGHRRWAANEQAMRRAAPLPQTAALSWVGALVVLLALMVVVLAIIDRPG